MKEGDQMTMTIEGSASETTDLAVRTQAMPTQWTPRFAVSVDDALHMIAEKRRFFAEAMDEGVHYGVIPGCEKPSLWKPGAELLLSSMGLQSQCSNEEPPIVDVMGTDHGGEPFIRYSRMCQVFRNGVMLAQAGGSCNSWEPKYRWRNEQRKCPACGRTSIIKAKDFENTGRDQGWVCWKKGDKDKKESCGAKFPPGDRSIEGQTVGKIPNPDVMDMDNTIKKMADKRAFIAATLLATGCSDIFTQDVEDFGADGNTEPEPPPPAQTKTVTARVVEPAPKREAAPRQAAKPAPATAPAADQADVGEVSEDVIAALLSRAIGKLHVARSKEGLIEWIHQHIPGSLSIKRSSDLRKRPKIVAAITATLDEVERNEKQ